jgi:hypothetical protein
MMHSTVGRERVAGQAAGNGWSPGGGEICRGGQDYWRWVLKDSEAGNGSNVGPQGSSRQWTFLDNHAHVLLCLARNPDMVMREVARSVGITERATQKIVKDLVDSQVLVRSRVGRCNSYRINLDHPLRHPLESQHTVGELLAMLLTEEELARARAPEPD